MEKVQVISVKPISSSGDECSTDSLAVNFPKVKGGSSNNGNFINKTPLFGSRGSSFSANHITKNCRSHSIPKEKLLNFDNFSTHSQNNNVLDEPVPIDRHRALSVSNHSAFTFPVPSQKCFGRSDFSRSSYNEHLKSVPSSLHNFSTRDKNRDKSSEFAFSKGLSVPGSGLYRSNSSLDLDHDCTEDPNPGSHNLHREYGSQGSINVVTATQQQNFYTILQKYEQNSNESVTVPFAPETTSPKVRSKIQRLWDRDKSIFRKLRSGKLDTKFDKADGLSEINISISGTVISNTNVKHGELMDNEIKLEDGLSKPVKLAKRPSIAHYDCHSLAAQLSPSRLRGLLADRSNTTTGASAAAMADPGSPQRSATNGSSEELSLEDTDHGDGRSNLLVSSCPFFRNEIGGEGERVVSLSRDIGRISKCSSSSPKATRLHRSGLASSVGLLEPSPGTSHWSQKLCPYVKRSPTVEVVDQGSNFYKTFFKDQEHQNWFGVDDNLGPMAISLKREKVDENGQVDKMHSLPLYQYRIIIRTSESFSCQGTLREESFSQRGDKDKSKGVAVREVLEYISPSLTLGNLRLGTSMPETEDALVRLDELSIHRKFKVGVLYCRSGQKTEEEMYNNENAGPAFSEFLENLGQRVRLKNFDKYRGGLDKKTDSTGHYSVYSQYQNCEVMFHVSTLLPFTANNRKQLLRKRHIGNDIVTIIFQEPGALPFSPKHIRSHFQHVFIIVQAVNPCTDNTMYSVAVSRFQDVPMFGPPIHDSATFPKSRKFTDFLIAKVINGEIAALRSDKFSCMAARTKHEYLKELTVSHSTNTPLDTSSKFSIMGFSRQSKKEKSRCKFVCDSSVRGALSWNFTLHDATLQQSVPCILGISVDSIVLLEESSSSVIFSTSCKTVLGWTIKTGQGLLFFYHQGECLLLNMPLGMSENDQQEVLNEVVARLMHVTQGAETQELILKRNSAGLLGFNVQQDGIITEVEPYGLAAQAGLQQGARLVEICTVALATLTQEQMVDLLKTSLTVTVKIIPPHLDGTPRRGCNVPTCSFLLGCSEGDYENLTPPEQSSNPSHPKNRVSQINRIDRSLSPPRSGSSSGYGTGSSSHSFSMEQAAKTQLAYQEFSTDEFTSNHSELKEKTNMGPPLDSLKHSDYTSTLSSTSSGHSDRWSEVNLDDHLCAPYVPSSSSHALYSHSSHSPSLRSSTQYSSPSSTLSSSSRTIQPSSSGYPSSPRLTAHSSCSSPRPPSPVISHNIYHRQSPLIQQNDKEYSPPPPPLPARIYQNNRDCKSEPRTPHYGNALHDIREIKASIRQSPSYPLFHPASHGESYGCEQSNYAVPAPIVRPVDKEYFEKNHKIDDGFSDYDNTSSSRVNTSHLNYKLSTLRRNSSPQTMESHDTREDSHRSQKSLSIPRAFPDDELIVHRSEDELSASSSNSPHGFPIKPGSSTSSIPSRNHSPLAQSQSKDFLPPKPDGPKGGEIIPPLFQPPIARLKQNVKGSSKSNRNSASLGSNLQEELLRLINPDYLSDSESMGAEIRGGKGEYLKKMDLSLMVGKESVKLSRSSDSCDVLGMKVSPDSIYTTSGLVMAEGKNSTDLYESLPTQASIGEKEFCSRKSVFTKVDIEMDLHNKTFHNIKMDSSKSQENRKPQSNEGMLLTARPATVISNTRMTHDRAEENAEAVTEITKKRETKPNKKLEEPNLDSRAPISSDLDEEWSSLVHTATQAIEQTSTIEKELTVGAPPPKKNIDDQFMKAGVSNASIRSVSQEARKISLEEAIYQTDPGSTVPKTLYQNFAARHSSSAKTESFQDDNGNALQPMTAQVSTPSISTSNNPNFTPNPNPTFSTNPNQSFTQTPNPNFNQIPNVHYPPNPNPEISSTEVRDRGLESRLERVEKALLSEQFRSEALKEEVGQLRSENKRLQEDNKAAATQLHQFTEWFFNTIDKG